MLKSSVSCSRDVIVSIYSLDAVFVINAEFIFNICNM